MHEFWRSLSHEFAIFAKFFCIDLPNVLHWSLFFVNNLSLASVRIPLMYTVSQEFPDSVKNMLLLKNPQFLPYHYEILTKEGTYLDKVS